MKTVGKKDLDTTACGYAPEGPDTLNCDNPTVIHAMILDTWEVVSFAASCAGHADLLRLVANYSHDIEPPCLGLEGRFLIRTDGSSFCYVPEDEADFQARITQPDIALVGPPA